MSGALLELEGIVCGRRPIGETSLLVTVLSERRGKLTLYARGALRDYRRIGGALDTGARSAWCLLQRPGGDRLPMVQQVDLVDAHPALRRDLGRLLRALFLIEVVRLHYGAGGALYEHLAAGLAAVDRRPRTGRGFLWWFVTRMLELSGHAPLLDHCVGCERDADLVGLDPNAGGVICRRCAAPSAPPLPLGVEALRVLRALSAVDGVDPRAAQRVGKIGARQVAAALRACITWPVGGDVALPALDTLQRYGA